MFFGAFIDRGEKVGACEGGGAGGEYQPTLERRNFSVLPQANQKYPLLTIFD